MQLSLLSNQIRETEISLIWLDRRSQRWKPSNAAYRQIILASCCIYMQNTPFENVPKSNISRAKFEQCNFWRGHIPSQNSPHWGEGPSPHSTPASWSSTTRLRSPTVTGFTYTGMALNGQQSTLCWCAVKKLFTHPLHATYRWTVL